MVQLSANSDAGTGATSASYSASSRGGLTSGAIAVITERLSELQELQLPSSLYRDAGGGAPSAHAILLYLEALLQKDPASFLARYDLAGPRSLASNRCKPRRCGARACISHFPVSPAP